MNKTQLAVNLIFQIALFCVVIFAFLFIPAGSMRYWQAWVYCGVFFVPTVAISLYYLVKDPEFLQRRMKSEEKEQTQKLVKLGANVLFFSMFVISGLDHRYGWSHVPFALAITSDIIVLASYLFIFRVFNENRYAASVIEVEAGQRVISTGTYAVVRHPMYSAALPMLLFTPLALGSYWALLPALIMPLMLVVRIKNEEEVLLRDLPGYDEYCRKVRWRLVPGIW